MRLASFIIVGILALSACTKLYMGSVEPVRTSDLKVGTTIDKIRQRLGEPAVTQTIKSPGEDGKQIVIFQYEDAVEEYWNKGPMWVLFDDNKLVTHGLGDTKYAELVWFSAYYDYLYTTNKMGRADTERAKYKKIQQLYQLTSYEDEYFTYRIVVGGKLDRKEIDNDEANYLIAQKKSDLDTKLEAARNNAISIAQTNELLRLQRASLIMQTLQTTQTTRNNINCTSTSFGSTWYTNCY